MSIPPNNIWQNIQHKNGKYYLQDDLNYIDVYNILYSHKNNNGKSTFIDLKCVPEPRLGSIDAPIYILQLNPSKVYPNNNSNIACELLSLKNDILPHIYLKNSNTWWDKYVFRVKDGFGDLLKKKGIYEDEQIRVILSNKICSVEYFPYNSEGFDSGYLRLPSQQYTRELVLYAIENNKCIIISRSAKLWFGLVPELNGYSNLYFCSSSQSVYISENNIIDKNGNKNQIQNIYNNYF